MRVNFLNINKKKQNETFLSLFHEKKEEIQWKKGVVVIALV